MYRITVLCSGVRSSINVASCDMDDGGEHDLCGLVMLTKPVSQGWTIRPGRGRHWDWTFPSFPPL